MNYDFSVMTEVPDKIKPILDRAFQIKTPITLDKGSFSSFVKSVVNGDSVVDFLVLSAALKNGKHGLISFILTNSKLIRISVSGNDDFSSDTAYLNQITGIQKSAKGGKAKIIVEFSQDSLGLSYPIGDLDIERFFQAVDQEYQKLRGRGE